MFKVSKMYNKLYGPYSFVLFGSRILFHSLNPTAPSHLVPRYRISLLHDTTGATYTFTGYTEKLYLV